MTSPSSDLPVSDPVLYSHQFTLSSEEFAGFRDLIYDLVGIHLTEQKKMLIISRLSRRLRQLQLSTFGEYLEYLRQSTDKETELVTLINQITTNKTDFFREQHHFDFLARELLPRMAQANVHNLRFWSAGCSTGQEAYTLAMVLADWLQGEPRARLASDIRILASDVDTNVLDHARRGLYSTESLQPIPSHFRDRYFSRSGKDWQIKPSLQEMIAFKRFNLMHEFPFKHGFDVIFCRNVLIYFNREDRVAIVNKFNSCLRPAGYLILGHSESLIAENCGFRSLGNTIYQKL